MLIAGAERSVMMKRPVAEVKSSGKCFLRVDIQKLWSKGPRLYFLLPAEFDNV